MRRRHLSLVPAQPGRRAGGGLRARGVIGLLWLGLLLTALHAAPCAAEMILRAAPNVTLPPFIHFAQPITGPLARGVPPPPLAVPGGDAGLQCRRAVQQAGRAAGVPEHLMSAIARVESGRRGADGQMQPWPWSINVAGTDHVYDTKEQAIIAVRQYQAQGIASIDVGCMQVNLMHHPHAFTSLEQAFDPVANAAYAARFLLRLFAQTGSWAAATADYHSATPELGGPYQQKVMSVLPQETLADARLGGATGQIGAVWPGGLARAPLRFLSQPPAAHVIPLALPQQGAPGGQMIGQAVGRGLAAYRAAPVRLASRLVR
jgi:hypothetical protein